MWQKIKCFFGFHNWYWFSSEARGCKDCSARQNKIIRITWEDC